MTVFSLENEFFSALPQIFPLMINDNKIGKSLSMSTRVNELFVHMQVKNVLTLQKIFCISLYFAHLIRWANMPIATRKYK